MQSSISLIFFPNFYFKQVVKVMAQKCMKKCKQVSFAVKVKQQQHNSSEWNNRRDFNSVNWQFQDTAKPPPLPIMMKRNENCIQTREIKPFYLSVYYSLFGIGLFVGQHNGDNGGVPSASSHQGFLSSGSSSGKLDKFQGMFLPFRDWHQ